jgi:Ca-activated chloride channel family protein
VFGCLLWRALLLAGLMGTVCARVTTAQLFSMPSEGDKLGGGFTSLSALRTAKLDSIIFQFNTPDSAMASPDSSVSTLDLHAPGKARQEYEKGYRQLLKKNQQEAVNHLTRAVSIYPKFVQAHNALGIAYLNFGKIQQARDEFALAVSLDEYQPTSYLNLGCAQLELEQYSEAVQSLKKASSIAPLYLQLQTALTYAEFKNRDYSGVIATTRFLHQHKHEGAAVVHLFAAAAWQAQHNLSEAQNEMEILLSEDSKSPYADQFRQVLLQMQGEQVTQAAAFLGPQAEANSCASEPNVQPDQIATIVSPQIGEASPGTTEHHQMARAKTESGATCIGCVTTASADRVQTSGASSGSEYPYDDVVHQIIRVEVQEIAMLFTATNHGKSVTNLEPTDIKIVDDNQPPATILGFYNMTQLPLRIGLLIDTSNSVTDRFSFEMGAASKFLETLVTDKNDLAFVVGFSWTPFLVQDFTSDQTSTARAITHLAPGGSTALWSAVAFAAEKLTSRPESQPVARVLVVITDGQDNSSQVSLQEAIWAAQRGQVAIYTVSTIEGFDEESNPSLGNHALKTLSEQTGGTIFKPGSLGNLKRSLADLQQVLRSRYLVHYKPPSSKPDGRYHAVDIRAEKDGHKLKVYARKGYYASALIDPGT